MDEQGSYPNEDDSGSWMPIHFLSRSNTAEDAESSQHDVNVQAQPQQQQQQQQQNPAEDRPSTRPENESAVIDITNDSDDSDEDVEILPGSIVAPPPRRAPPIRRPISARYEPYYEPRRNIRNMVPILQPNPLLHLFPFFHVSDNRDEDADPFWFDEIEGDEDEDADEEEDEESDMNDGSESWSGEMRKYLNKHSDETNTPFSVESPHGVSGGTHNTSATSTKAANPVGQTKLDYTCPICLETSSRLASTKCGHVFCIKCIRNYFRKTYSSWKCPLCSKPMAKKDIHPLYL